VRGALGRILVVDDEPMVVRAVSQILARMGYEVISAAGPIEAAARFAAAPESVDLVLTDVVMPDGGGRKLVQQLREREPALRVLFMSGFTGHESIREDERQLPGPLLTKPFTAARLVAAVQDALDGDGDGARA
jgi:DNA-binding NtrC family response regulator